MFEKKEKISKESKEANTERGKVDIDYILKYSLLRWKALIHISKVIILSQVIIHAMNIIPRINREKNFTCLHHYLRADKSYDPYPLV